MSDPPHSDIDFKNKMACVWTTLKTHRSLERRLYVKMAENYFKILEVDKMPKNSFLDEVKKCQKITWQK